jgi:hypothetical protein
MPKNCSGPRFTNLFAFTFGASFVSILSIYPDNVLISDLPIGTIVSDENLDAGLLSDKAVIAGQFFEAFAPRQRQIDPGSANHIADAATVFVEQYQIGKWDLFVLLNSSMPDCDIMALFAFLAMQIGPEPEQHLFFEGKDGALVRHLVQTN